MITHHPIQTDSTVPAADVKESVWTIDASTNKTISQLNPSDGYDLRKVTKSFWDGNWLCLIVNA